jgi:hypothetical protein
MKFQIRDLLWLMVVAALATGWFLDRVTVRRLSNQLAAERERVAELMAQERAARAQAEKMLSVARQAVDKALQTAAESERP